MKTSRNARFLFASIFLTSTLAMAGTARGSFERTLQVSGSVDLDVKTGSGKITVRSGGSGAVQIRASIQARDGDGMSGEEKVRDIEANPPIVQTGNTIRIGHFERRELRQRVSISYDLVVPESTRLNSSTGSGNQEIQGLQGPVKASTGSGDLLISNIGSELKADTGSGDIRLNQVHGPIKADTGSGSIHAQGVAGEFKADTGSGDVTVEETSGGDVKVETGSGNIDVRGVNGSLQAEAGSGNIKAQGTPTGRWRLESGSGELELRLAGNQGYDVDARTSSGRVYAAQPITMEGSISATHLRGKIKGGGTMLDLETGSGNIRIE